MALPTITPKDLHIVQLSPKLRKVLHERARRANQRAYAPVLAADRGEIGLVNQTFHKEAAGARGATQTVENALSHVLAGLQGSGLKGGYLRQVQNEITSRQTDNASALPFLLSDARENRTEGLQKARSQLVQDRASKLQGTAEDFNQLLKEARGAGSALEKERAGRRRSEREGAEHESKFDPKDLLNAKLALKDALSKWAQNPTVEVNGEEVPLHEAQPLRTATDWHEFATAVAEHYSGFGLAEINQVINNLLHERKRKEHEGRLPQPGVPGAGRGGY